MNTEKNNDTNRRSPNYMLMAVGFLGILGVLSGWLFAQMQKNKADRATYIVKHKVAQKISYAPIENQSDLHVMEFGPFSTDSLLYKKLNVGDTISGCKSALDEPVVPASRPHTGPYYTGTMGAFSDTRDYDIRTVNGKTLFEIKQKEMQDAQRARRDSLLREMKQR